MYYLYVAEENKKYSLYDRKNNKDDLLKSISKYLSSNKLDVTGKVVFRIESKNILLDNEREFNDMGKTIPYSNEEFEFLRDLYINNFGLRDIVKRVNEEFHNGEEVRTTNGVKFKLNQNNVFRIKITRERRDVKLCKTCGVEKPIERFPHNRTLVDGYESVCKQCRNKKVKKDKQQAFINYRLKYKDVKVVCQNCYKVLGMIPIVNEENDEKRILQPSKDVIVTLGNNKELGMAKCTCSKITDLNKYYEEWFR